MQKLVAVEEAKALFEQAKDWPVWRWLLEKKRARSTADAAWDALERQEEKVKARWTGEWIEAYRDLSAHDHSNPPRRAPHDPEPQTALDRLWSADRRARDARDAAEAQFDQADRCLSAAMAREGARMAIEAWELREKFLRQAEALARRK